MNLTYKLLDHPFYQAWSHGKITQAQLASYARSYAEFIDLMPAYWTRIGRELDADTAPIVADEAHHAILWAQWAARLPTAVNWPRMTTVLETFAQSTASELLGAVHAFEVQQPGVARTKQDGLLAHYGFTKNETRYFEEHLNEQEHIEFGNHLAATKADPDEFTHGFEHGAKVVYHSLDLFIG